jgi:hypothetical protein
MEKSAIIAVDTDTMRNLSTPARTIECGRKALRSHWLFYGFYPGLLSLITPLAPALLLAIYGILIGAIYGLIFHSLSGGERDFTSVSGLRAAQYHVMVDEELAAEAERLLANG